MIPPDAQVAHHAVMNSGFRSELTLGAIFIQTRHCKKLIVRNTCRVVHRNKAIRIAGVSDDQRADSRRGIGSNCLPQLGIGQV